MMDKIKIWWKRRKLRPTCPFNHRKCKWQNSDGKVPDMGICRNCIVCLTDKNLWRGLP